MYFGVAHHPTFPEPGSPRLELRLHERHNFTRRRQKRDGAGQDRAQRNERRIGGDQVERFARKSVGCKCSKIRSFHHRNARIVAQSPIQLSVTDVDRHHMRGAAL